MRCSAYLLIMTVLFWWSGAQAQSGSMPFTAPCCVWDKTDKTCIGRCLPGPMSVEKTREITACAPSELAEVLKQVLDTLQPERVRTMTLEIPPTPGSAAWLRRQAFALEAEAKAQEARDALLTRARALVQQCGGQ